MAAASLPRARRSRIAGAAWWVVAVLVTIVVTGSVVGSAIGPPMGAWTAVALMVGPLFSSRRWPLASGIAVVTGASWAAFIGLNDQIRLLGMIAIAVAVASAAVRVRRRSLVLVGVALALPTVAFFAAPRHEMNSAIGLSLVLTVAAGWGVGNSLHQRRAYTAALQAQATEQAVTEERLRIARELHDMVAHSMGIIAIQSGVGSRVIASQPDEARNALSAIEVASRETLAGLRGMLGALRTADSDPLQLVPSPGLADLDRLVETAAISDFASFCSAAGNAGPSHPRLISRHTASCRSRSPT